MTHPSLDIVIAARGGGVQKINVRLANALSQAGLDTTFVMPEWSGPHLGELDPSVGRYDLGTRHAAGVVWRLARRLRRARPEVVKVTQPHMIVATWLALKLARVRPHVVAVIQNELEALRQDPRWLVRRVPAMLGRALAAFDEIVCVSSGVADSIAREFDLPRERLHVIYNPVVTSHTPELVAAPCPHPWFHDRDTPVFLGVGNLNAQKDFQTLVRAFARVCETIPARLVILGEGPQRRQLEELVSNLGIETCVDLPGFAENPLAYMSRATAFVLSSRWEGFGIVVAEALAAGCPVISTNCKSGPAEILGDGRWGSLVPVGDTERLAAAMVAAVSVTQDKDELIRRANDFALDHVVQQYSSVFSRDAVL